MLAYLEKFNNLPADIRNKVSDSRAMLIIEELEKKYNVNLAALIMKVVVKEININNLIDYFLKEKLNQEQARELTNALKEKIFSKLEDYLLFDSQKSINQSVDDIVIKESKVKSSSFFFSPEDEEEIRNLTQKIIIAESSSLTPKLIDDKIKEITRQAQINFGSVELAERFAQILKTYLRGIRDKLDTKATLMKSFSSGGLSFDEDSAQKAILLADKVLSSEPAKPIEPLPKIKLPESEKADFLKQRSVSRDAAYDFSKIAARGEKIKQDLRKLDTKHELAPLTPTVKPAIKQIEKPKVKDVKPASAPAKTEDPGTMPLIKRRFEAENLSQSQKTRIEDVKYVPRVMGPMEEIKYMDIVNFRRLDKDPIKGVEKIKNKINLLEEDYGKKLEGIKFWRQSPIYKLYLEIGNSSIKENKPVDVIIEARRMAGLDYLSENEFKAIMDLNKSLRF